MYAINYLSAWHYLTHTTKMHAHVKQITSTNKTICKYLVTQSKLLKLRMAGTTTQQGSGKILTLYKLDDRALGSYS